MDKQKQIEEMASCLIGKVVTGADSTKVLGLGYITVKEISFILVNAGYRKIPENAVVVPDMADKDFYAVEKSEWDKMVQGAKDIIHEREEKARKETAEKFAERVKYELHEWLEYNESLDGTIKFGVAMIELIGVKSLEGEVISESLIDEICKEFTEGKNGKT